jgi:hypothetical protein
MDQSEHGKRGNPTFKRTRGGLCSVDSIPKVPPSSKRREDGIPLSTQISGPAQLGNLRRTGANLHQNSRVPHLLPCSRPRSIDVWFRWIGAKHRTGGLPPQSDVNIRNKLVKSIIHSSTNRRLQLATNCGILLTSCSPSLSTLHQHHIPARHLPPYPAARPLTAFSRSRQALFLPRLPSGPSLSSSLAPLVHFLSNFGASEPSPVLISTLDATINHRWNLSPTSSLASDLPEPPKVYLPAHRRVTVPTVSLSPRPPLLLRCHRISSLLYVRSSSSTAMSGYPGYPGAGYQGGYPQQPPYPPQQPYPPPQQQYAPPQQPQYAGNYAAHVSFPGSEVSHPSLTTL